MCAFVLLIVNRLIIVLCVPHTVLSMEVDLILPIMDTMQYSYTEVTNR